MKKTFQLILLNIAVIAAAMAPMGAIATLIWLRLTPTEKVLALRVMEGQWVLVFLVIVISLFALNQLVLWWWQTYPGQFSRLAESIALAAQQPRKSRLNLAGPADVQAIAQAANALIDRLQTSEDEIDERINMARGSLVDERNLLATLMTELPVGVIVCNADGRILLYNKRARLQVKALQYAAHVLEQETLLGLGRSIFKIFDRDDTQAQLAQMAVLLANPDYKGVPHCYLTSVMASADKGVALRAHMSPVLAAADDKTAPRGISGFVLIVQHTDGEADEAETHHTHNHNRPHSLAGSGPASEAVENRPDYYDFDLFSARELVVDLDRPLDRMAFTAFDTETTGLNPANGDEIIEIGAVRLVNGRLLRGETFDQLIHPGRLLTAENIAIHGITDERLHGRPTISQVLPAFHAFCEDTVLVAHNAAFDMRFLQMKEAVLGLRFGQPVLDTLLLSDILSPQQESHSLEEIAQRLGVSIQGRHTALGDALVTAQIFVAMLPLLQARGLLTLRQVLEACQHSRFARITY